MRKQAYLVCVSEALQKRLKGATVCNPFKLIVESPNGPIIFSLRQEKVVVSFRGNQYHRPIKKIACEAYAAEVAEEIVDFTIKKIENEQLSLMGRIKRENNKLDYY